MERIAHTPRHRVRPAPRRVGWLWALCAFAAGAFCLLAAASSLGEALLGPRELPQNLLDAPFISQREKYPTGCESVSAVMALQFAGVEVTVEEFIDGYLPQGDAPHDDGSGQLVGANPWEKFLGSPYREDGWGCYAPVIAGAMERLLQDRGEQGWQVLDLSGAGLETLCREYAQRGIPVLVWATIDMEEPVPSTQFLLEGTGELFTWTYPLHCLLLTGGDGEWAYFNDPLEGKNTPYPWGKVEAAYQGVGAQALALAPAG